MALIQLGLTDQLPDVVAKQNSNNLYIINNVAYAQTAGAASVGGVLESILKTGWYAVGDTWTYASANTITVPTGAANRYQKGDRIKWTQTTVKYGVIIAVADTLLTILKNTDFVVANAAISLNYYSHELNPIGYPCWFNVAAPIFITIDNGSGGQPTTSNNRVSIIGSQCFVHYRGNGIKDVTGTTFNCPMSAYPPTANSVDRTLLGSSYVQSPSDTPITGNVVQISNTIWFAYQTSMTDNSTISNWNYQLNYEI